jgi:hypothetical protein
VLVTGPVVEERLALSASSATATVTRPPPDAAPSSAVSAPACVASGRPGDEPERVLVRLHLAPETLRRGERPAEELEELVLLQRTERHHPGPAQQRRVDLEARILGGGAEQGERPSLHVRQERVLLCLVEAVDLVEEEDRALAVEARPLLGWATASRMSFTPADNRGHLDEGGLRRARPAGGPGSSSPCRAAPRG